MEDYIKYKRFTQNFENEDDIQLFFDTLITDGWQIISYYESANDITTLNIVVVAGRKRGKV